MKSIAIAVGQSAQLGNKLEASRILGVHPFAGDVSQQSAADHQPHSYSGRSTWHCSRHQLVYSLGDVDLVNFGATIRSTRLSLGSKLSGRNQLARSATRVNVQTAMSNAHHECKTKQPKLRDTAARSPRD